MKIYPFLAVCLLASNLVFGQSKEEEPEYTEEMALYKAKEFVAFELLDKKETLTKFRLVPLAASESAEMTTLYFQCEAQNKEGLLLGFNGEQVGKDGSVNEASDFYYIPKAKALDFLNRMEEIFEKHEDYLSDEKDQNNGLLHFGDMRLVSYQGGDAMIRLFWNGFDSEWEYDDCKDTKKEFMDILEDNQKKKEKEAERLRKEAGE